jgi:hypothetical protein
MALIPDAITVEIPSNKNFISSQAGICLPFDEYHERRKPKPYWTSALWDTGASHSSIFKSLAENIGLSPIDQAQIQHAGGISLCNIYLANIYVTDKYYLELELTETIGASSDFELIIGMDVISQGDFAFTNKEDHSLFSFRLPSQTYIDFNKA